MLIEQKLFMGGLTIRFDFADDDLGFTQFAGGTGRSVAYRLRYTDIPRETTTVTVPNQRMIRLTYLAGLIAAVAVWGPAQSVPALGWIVSCGWLTAVVTVRRSCAIGLIQFNTKMGRLQVMQNKQTARVLDEINAGRTRAFLGQYDGMDARAAGTRNALIWLQKEGYLTEEAFRTRLALLDAPAIGDDIPERGRLN